MLNHTHSTTFDYISLEDAIVDAEFNAELRRDEEIISLFEEKAKKDN